MAFPDFQFGLSCPRRKTKTEVKNENIKSSDSSLSASFFSRWS